MQTVRFREDGEYDAYLVPEEENMKKGMNEKNYLIAWAICSIYAGVASCWITDFVKENDALFPIETKVIYCCVGAIGVGIFLFPWMKKQKDYWGEYAKMESVAQIMFFSILAIDLIFLASGSNYAFKKAVKNNEVVSCKIDVRNEFYCMVTSEKIYLKEKDSSKWKELKNKLEKFQAGSWRARISNETKLEAICRGNYCFSVDEFLNNKVLRTGKIKREKSFVEKLLKK